MLLPTLRTRLNTAVPSLRNCGASVAKVIAASGTNTKPVPSPCANPDQMTDAVSICR